MNLSSEARRLGSLRDYRILDTAAERVFDDLTRLATTICGTPISLVSLVDENRQWFKSKVGLDTTETSRDIAFCAHAIEDDQPFIVEDAAADARFVNNPLVTDDPGIRFYAGIPLIVADGSALGTLCVIDREPRRLDVDQVRSLSVLRDAVVSNLELRKSLVEINAMRKLLPMCAWCRNVKDDNPETGDSQWMSLESFVDGHSRITHGICPSCSDDMIQSVDEDPNA